MTSEVDEAIVTVRKSEVREEIVRELYTESNLRPSEIYERIDSQVDTTKENFYQNLRALTEGIVNKIEGSRRMTLYSLTDLGKQVAEEQGLTKTDKERLRNLAFEVDLSADEITDVLEDVVQEKEGS